MKVYIYGLHAPGDETIMYVGYSGNPKARLKAHIASGRSKSNLTPVKLWIKSLLDNGQVPCMRIIEVLEEKVMGREMAVTEEYRKLNPDLTNCIHISQIRRQQEREESAP